MTRNGTLLILALAAALAAAGFAQATDVEIRAAIRIGDGLLIIGNDEARYSDYTTGHPRSNRDGHYTYGDYGYGNDYGYGTETIIIDGNGVVIIRRTTYPNYRYPQVGRHFEQHAKYGLPLNRPDTLRLYRTDQFGRTSTYAVPRPGSGETRTTESTPARGKTRSEDGGRRRGDGSDD